MEERSERYKRYLQSLEEEKQIEIAEHSQLIDTFIGHCRNLGFTVQRDNIDYTRVIGLMARQPNIVYDLLPKLQKDKEGLIPLSDLTTVFKITPAKIGQFLATNFIAFAHPFFRRSFYRENAYAPLFIQKFLVTQR